MADEPTPGDNATPPVAAAPAAPVEAPPSGSEPDNNSGDPAMVPSDRLREETEKRRKAEEDNERLQQELEASKAPPPTNDDDPDPDVEKLLDSYAKRKGLVSQEELAAERSKIQVEQDINELTANPPNPGIPYDNKAVMDYAKSNNMPITSRTALRAAYRELNYDKIVEATKQSAIEGYRKAGSSGAELPGSSGAVAPTEPELTGKTPKERARERIRNARQKLTV